MVLQRAFGLLLSTGKIAACQVKRLPRGARGARKLNISSVQSSHTLRSRHPAETVQMVEAALLLTQKKRLRPS